MLSYNFYLGLRDKTEKRNCLFCAWKSRVRIPHGYALSISLLSFFMLFLLLLRDNGHCRWKSWSVVTSSVIDHSHTWDKKITFYGCQTFLSRPACLILGLNCCLKMSIITRWAAQWQNQQNSICAQRRLRSAWASTQSDQSSQSAWRKLGSLASSYPLNAQRRLLSDWADAQTDLSLGWGTVILLVLSWGGSYIDALELLLQHVIGLQLHLETKTMCWDLKNIFFLNYRTRIWIESVTRHHQE